MIRINRKSLAVLAAIILTSASAAYAAPAVELIVLKDTQPERLSPAPSSDQAQSSLALMREQMARAREAALAELDRIRRDVGTQGYAVVPDTALNSLNSYLEQRDSLIQRAALTESAQATSMLSNLSATDFAKGKLIGASLPSDGESPVDMVGYLFDFPDLGNVVLEETNYRTSNASRIVVAKPSGNITINGIPGDYTVLRGKAGNGAWTILQFHTDEKIFKLAVSDEIQRDDPRFEQVIRLAEVLY